MTPERLRKIINKYVKKWKDNLFLGMWHIIFNIRDYMRDEGGSYSTCAECDTSWKYLTAVMDFNYVQLKNMDEEEIEKIVIHELLHIAVNEMREEGIDHEERVVSHLAIVVSYLDREKK